MTSAEIAMAGSEDQRIKMFQASKK